MKFKSIQSAIVVLAGACLFVAVGLVTLYSINSAERSQRFVQDSSQNLIERRVQDQLIAVATAESQRIRRRLNDPFMVANQLAELNRLLGGLEPDGLRSGGGEPPVEVAARVTFRDLEVALRAVETGLDPLIASASGEVAVSGRIPLAEVVGYVADKASRDLVLPT